MVEKIKGLVSPKSVYKVSKNAFFVFVIFVAFFSFYHVGYAKRIIPGVKVGGVSVGGMSYSEAKNILTKRFGTLDTNLVLVFEEVSQDIGGEEISLKYDVGSTVSRAFELGRTGNFFLDTKDKLASLLKTLNIKAVYVLDEEALSREFSKIRGEINVAPKNAEFVFKNGELKINATSNGRKVSDQGMFDLVIASFDHLDFEQKEIPVVMLKSKISENDLKSAKTKVEKIISNPLKIVHKEESWEFSPEEILDLVSIEPKLTGAKVKLDKTKFDGFVDVLALEINKLPRGNVISEIDNVVTGFEIIEEGSELDIRQFTEDFEKALLGSEEIVVAQTTVIDSLDDPSKYGIFTLLGEGESKYTGSGAPRAHNLTLAADRTDGVLVPPGEIYSFNNSVGEISGETGYDSAYIISNGKTILGEGGGVCQTSTTLFRAVLDSGLPIVTRYPHAYRVYYYELDQPVGFDASIYQPSLDFQFENDSPNHVLVQSEWNSHTQVLGFKIYGTPDGREVKITEPVVSNLIPPPETEYYDDPELPKGEVKQMDFAAWGATSSFTRTVTRGEDTLFADVFNTTYQPWKAVYAVGTAD